MNKKSTKNILEVTKINKRYDHGAIFQIIASANSKATYESCLDEADLLIESLH